MANTNGRFQKSNNFELNRFNNNKYHKSRPTTKQTNLESNNPAPTTTQTKKTCHNNTTCIKTNCCEMFEHLVVLYCVCALCCSLLCLRNCVMFVVRHVEHCCCACTTANSNARQNNQQIKIGKIKIEKNEMCGNAIQNCPI